MGLFSGGKTDWRTTQQKAKQSALLTKYAAAKKQHDVAQKQADMTRAEAQKLHNRGDFEVAARKRADASNAQKFADKQGAAVKSMETGPKGGRFYVSEAGAKVYIK